jgi:hypothetical protein
MSLSHDKYIAFQQQRNATLVAATKLKSYGAAKQEILPGVERRQHR